MRLSGCSGLGRVGSGRFVGVGVRPVGAGSVLVIVIFVVWIAVRTLTVMGRTLMSGDMRPMTTGRMLLGVSSSVLFVSVLFGLGLVGSSAGLAAMVLFVVVGWWRAVQ